MRRISDTMARMRAMADATSPSHAATGDRLARLTDFGSNPGALEAWAFAPPNLPANAPLVVVLHGCTQNAAGYDEGAGWSQLAEAGGFALLLPEQRRANNPNLCFNWFVPEDSRRDSGEPLSIRQMIGTMIARHRIDPARVFITGLSAGGAMTSVMLATYPELFAGGAIIAGLPFGTAGNVSQALDRMRGHGLPDDTALAALLRRGSSHEGPWPAISVWHGTADGTVTVTNADAIIDQWRAVHGLGREPDAADLVDGYPHRVWHDRRGNVAIEDYRITGLGHGTPLATHGDEGCGRAGPHMLEAGISSTRRIAHGWGLVGAPANVARVANRTDATSATNQSASRTNGVGGIIEHALRAAGLMR